MTQIKAYQDNTENNCEQLVLQHLKLVKRLAVHLLNRLPKNIQLNDLIQSGVVGLIEAAQNFQPDRGAQFETFATLRIRGAMLDDIRRNNWVPRSVYQNARSISEAIATIEHETGQEAKSADVAAKLGVSLNEYFKMLNDSGTSELFSLSDLSIESTCPSPDIHNPAYHVEKLSLASTLTELLKTLPPREQAVLALYHNEGLTMKDIGKALDIGESRVSQLHHQAIHRLRARFKNSLVEIT